MSTVRYYEIFTEEQSAQRLFEQLVPRFGISDDHLGVYSFRGKEDLESKLPDRLSGYAGLIESLDDQSLQYVIVVVVDRDDDDCERLKQQLESILANHDLDEGVVRIVIPELEAWYLGDPEALRSVFERLPNSF